MSIIKQSLVSSSKYNIKCPYSMKPIGIAIHNTYNDASAANEISYMKSNNNQVSFHIAVDDKEAIQGLPLDRNSWSCGDGSGGQGNRKHISIEICYSKSGGTRFDNAEKLAAKVVAELLNKYNWSIDNVKAHRDFANKNCPHRTNMTEFKKLILEELNNSILPNDFNPVTYLKLYKDVLLECMHKSTFKPLDHYKEFGAKEGRVYNNDIDYLFAYEDVLLAVNNNSSLSAEKHYLDNGKNEGRQYK